VTGIAHVSMGLLLKARFRSVPLLWLLLAAEVADLLWVALNLLHAGGAEPVEIARVGQPMRGFADLHLIRQPWSHSLAMTLAVAGLLGWLAFLALRARAAALAVFLAAASHWLLDFLSHDADLPLWPGAGAPMAGPALNFDASAPARGLNATWPLAGWALQSLIVVVAGIAFWSAFPATRRRRWWFWVALAALAGALPAALFLEMAFPLGTQPFILLTLGEIALTVGVVWGVTRWTHPAVRETHAPYSPVLTERLRGAKRAAGALCWLVAAAYLAQSIAGADAPAISRYSLALAALYLWIGSGIRGFNLGDLWWAVWLPFAWGPLARAVWGAGAITPFVAGLEILLGVVAVSTIHRLRTSKVML
jgi:hypothetical protein